MLRALVYLRLTSFKNWVLWRARRLRQPKYFVGAIVGVAYFYFFFFRRGGTARMPAMHAVPAEVMPTDGIALAFALAALALFIVMILMWAIPTERAALGFSEAEIAFLFPAPIGRRVLVHFRLISAQLRSLAAGLVMALVSNRWSMLGGNALTHALGWWFIFATLNLHFTGAKFAMTRLADRGLAVWFRRILILVAALAVIGITLWHVPAPATYGGGPTATPRGFGHWLVAFGTTAPLSWLIFPLRLVVAPFLASDTAAFLRATGPAFLVMGLHYLWAVRTVSSFEEASIDHAEKRSARLAAWRSGERRFSAAPAKARQDPFRLASRGRPEIAFLWKNLLATWPYFTLRMFLRVAVLLVIVSLWLKRHPDWLPPGLVPFVASLAGGYILVVGPQFARQDLRSDMRRLDLLKTYPLAGWQIVLGELLTPAAILTGLVWLAWLVVVVNADTGTRLTWLNSSVRSSVGLAGAMLVPPLVMLQLLVPNAAAVVFPGWFEATRGRGGGPEVMGQRMIFFFAQLLTMVVALLPAAITAFALVVILQRFIGLSVAVYVATTPVVIVLLAEVALGLWWLGGRFETIDVAEELRS